MRRLFRILLNAATVLSLVMCVATMAAWVRSYRAHDYVWWSWANPRLLLGIGTYRGGLFAGVSTLIGTVDYLPPPGVEWDHTAPLGYTEAGGSQGTFFNRFGFALDYFPGGATVWRRLASPYWFMMLLTAILPGARLAKWRRRARRLRMRRGLCRNCGYDCRATPDRCPECGAVPPKPS
jgi:hypothetical protein